MIILSQKLFSTVSESLHVINGRPASLVNVLLTYSDTERALQRVIYPRVPVSPRVTTNFSDTGLLRDYGYRITGPVKYE